MGCTGLTNLSHMVDPIIDEGELDTANALDNIPEQFRQIEIAREKARADNRTWRVTSMTELVEPPSGSVSAQKSIAHAIKRKHLMTPG